MKIGGEQQAVAASAHKVVGHQPGLVVEGKRCTRPLKRCEKAIY